MTDNELKDLIARVVKEAVQNEAKSSSPCCVEEGEVEDLSKIDLRKELNVENCANRDEFLRIKAKTSMRYGSGRSGCRPLTRTYLRYLADQASAMDAVFNAVPQQLLDDMNLFTVCTRCESKDVYLSRPDLGKQFDEATAKVIKEKCIANPDVQIVVSDGLSSTAVAANIPDLLPALMQGLKAKNLKVGTPFYILNGRVAAEDAVSEILGAKVTIILLGERPGLATSKSLSAYMVYGGYVGIPEANRTVVSNIHVEGTNPAEAGAHIADIAEKMLKAKASGLDLKL